MDSGPPIQIRLRVRPDPPRVGLARIELRLLGPTGVPQHGAAVKIEGNMSHPGMAPSLADAREVAPGDYRADLRLTMAGDWTLRVDARLADGETAHRTLNLPRVSGR